MNNFMTNWKTSLGGVATMAMGIMSLFGVHVAGQAAMDPNSAMAAIMAGFGLLFAKDGA